VELTFNHYRILHQADSSNFRELLMGVRTSGLGENDYEWPPLELEDARAALHDLVRAGYVEVFAERETALPKAKAIEAVSDDAAWEQLDPDAPDYYEIYYTDEGLRALKEASDLYRNVGLVSQS
jgi:hypothetical protein